MLSSYSRLEDPIVTIELDGCIYFKFVTSTGKITISFVSSKSRIVPTKKIDLLAHRLELLGNLVLSKLMINALPELQNDIVIDSVYCWTDYQIALGWIGSVNREFKTFVPNRVLSIRKNVDYLN